MARDGARLLPGDRRKKKGGDGFSQRLQALDFPTIATRTSAFRQLVLQAPVPPRYQHPARQRRRRHLDSLPPLAPMGSRGHPVGPHGGASTDDEQVPAKQVDDRRDPGENRR
ncbi:hypothetical protein LO762_25775 [Actinocorallia sp. API 0066]|uniref:hypothetical protein n=1 Tax=Actinocorallia sp. API 0066 TaxID=2896846 RepID=UPI001E40B455|nr:hypothetical protein [Actinocorallia sp. API 0066]MCD0452566.1 hypothetical protein [Actinocorallia sp. API 0066]